MHNSYMTFLLGIFLFSACAHAKPPVVKPVPAPLPEYVDFDDAKMTLEAERKMLDAERADNIAKIEWLRARTFLIDKYGVDPLKGEGWEPDEHGRLKVKRNPPPPPAKPAKK